MWLILGAFGVIAAVSIFSSSNVLHDSKPRWICKAGDRCTRWAGEWHRNLPDNSVEVYSTPPDNFKSLIVINTYPEYQVYKLPE